MTATTVYGSVWTIFGVESYEAAARALVGDYDLDAIAGHLRAAHEVLLPEGFVIAGDQVIGPVGVEFDREAIREAVADLDRVGFDLAPFERDGKEPIMNPHALGTPECIAYAYGVKHRQTHYEPVDNPLSGEWVGEPTPADVIRAVWCEILGPSWDTYIDGTDDDRDADDAILDAWEEGYFSV